MSETSSNGKDSLGYLGPAFQLKVLWQILTNVEFGNDIIPNLHSHYFDNVIHKRILSLIKRYLSTHNKVPQLNNRSVNEAALNSNFNEIEKLEIKSVIDSLNSWENKIISGIATDDSDVVQKNLWLFVKQQEYKKFADKVYEKIKSGTLDENVNDFEESLKKISMLGMKDDFGKDIFDDIQSALQKDFRNPIPTGIDAIDRAMAGGLGREEIGLILAGLGVGKSTILTKIANTAFNLDKKVLQIVFEDKVDAIRRKHYAIWSKIPLSQMDDRSEEVYDRVIEYQANSGKNGGRLIIIKMDQDGITIPEIKKWINNYQKTFSIKFDMVVIDYIDCIEAHKPTGGDDLKSELIVIKAFESMAAEFKIPCWSAVQSNRSGLESEFVNTYQMGGSIKKAQKTHFLMSVAKSNDQKQDNTANIQILKARFAKDGLRFENAIFNNDTLEIRCINYGSGKPAPFKSNGSLDTSLDAKMRSDYLDSGLDLTIEDYDKRMENLKGKEDEKPPEDDDKKTDGDATSEDDGEPVIV